MTVPQLLGEYLNRSICQGMTLPHLLMILLGILLITLGGIKGYKPLLLLPIGFGMILGNLPGLQPVGASEFSLLEQGMRSGLFPALIFLGMGAATDFSSLLSNPKLVLLGCAAPIGIAMTLLGMNLAGVPLADAAAMSMAGAANGPTSVYLASKLSPDLIGPIAVAAYLYMALVPVIQPWILRGLTTREERRIQMPAIRESRKSERVCLPLMLFGVCVLVSPGSVWLIGMLCFGNLLREIGVTERLVTVARGTLLDAVTLLLGLMVGASATTTNFVTPATLLLLGIGLIAFVLATASGIGMAKLMNRVCDQKTNPLLGAAGVSAFPDSARIVHEIGQEEDPSNFLLDHATAPNLAGLIGSVLTAGLFWMWLG
ncbi:MAG: sodium ion-translocating decarboxylase subunit beta [Kiritimatiellia bacterium]